MYIILARKLMYSALFLMDESLNYLLLFFVMKGSALCTPCMQRAYSPTRREYITPPFPNREEVNPPSRSEEVEAAVVEGEQVARSSTSINSRLNWLVGLHRLGLIISVSHTYAILEHPAQGY